MDFLLPNHPYKFLLKMSHVISTKYRDNTAIAASSAHSEKYGFHQPSGTFTLVKMTPGRNIHRGSSLHYQNSIGLCAKRVLIVNFGRAAGTIFHVMS